MLGRVSGIEYGRCPIQSLGYGALFEGKSEILAGACLHAAEHLVLTGGSRIDHDFRCTGGADNLHQSKSEFGFAIDVNEDDFEILLQQAFQVA